MTVFTVGLNHKKCSIEVREKVHFDSRKLESALSRLPRFPEVSEIVVLSTCNRMELYGTSVSSNVPLDSLLRLIEEVHGIPRGDFSPYLYQYQSKDAIRHLCF